MNNRAMRLSVARYRMLCRRVDLSARPLSRSPEYRDALTYLRELYAEYGARAIRAEIERQVLRNSKPRTERRP